MAVQTGSSQGKTGSSAGNKTESSGRKTGQSGRKAAEDTVNKHSTKVEAFGTTVTLPGYDELAFFGGIGALALLGVLEWPVAGLLMAGHALSRARHNTMLHEFGEALEQA